MLERRDKIEAKRVIDWTFRVEDGEKNTPWCGRHAIFLVGWKFYWISIVARAGYWTEDFSSQTSPGAERAIVRSDQLRLATVKPLDAQHAKSPTPIYFESNSSWTINYAIIHTPPFTKFWASKELKTNHMLLPGEIRHDYCRQDTTRALVILHLIKNRAWTRTWGCSGTVDC